MRPPGTLEWKLLADLVQERFGLAFEDGRRELLHARLQPRLRSLHLQSLTEYYHYLRFHPDREAEFTHLAARVTNNETYFFREAHHFDVLLRHVVPPIMPELRHRPLRLLSAGCSSGEEPYSLVIALQNAGMEQAGVRWEIEACDVNPERIARAREAFYEAASLRACSEEDRRRYFTPRQRGFLLKPRHRSGVRFFEINLAAAPALRGAPYDAILCRNLLIYFSDEAFDRLIELFRRSLTPGGYLLLGHSESLIDRAGGFEPVCVEQGVVYRKPAS